MYSPKVAVVDSGVDTQNQEIMEHVIQGFSFQKSAEEDGEKKVKKEKCKKKRIRRKKREKED